MADTPLELYSKAYKHHYEAGEVEAACLLYREIIKNFPESNECAYAAIQLEKVMANEAAGNLRIRKSKAGWVALAVALVALTAVAGASALGYRYVKQLESKARFGEMVNLALGKMLTGENEEALKILAALKRSEPDNIVPVELAAGIQVLQQRYVEAVDEFEAYKRRNPNDASVNSKIAQLKARLAAAPLP